MKFIKSRAKVKCNSLNGPQIKQMQFSVQSFNAKCEL